MEHDSTPQPQDSPLSLDQIYKEAQVGLCVFGTDLRYVYINAWLAALNGIPVEDHLGRTVGEVLPDLASRIESQLQQVIDTGQPLVEGTVFGLTMARSGDKRRFQHTYHPIMSSDGSIKGVNCVVHDVTESTGAVKSLKLTQFALDHALNPVFFIRDDGSFFYVNKAACRALGYSREELLSLSVPDITPDYPPGTWADRWRKMREGRKITFEGRHRTKDGRVFPVEVTANHLEFQGIEYSCAFARDITEHKRAEEQLRENEQKLRQASEEQERLSRDLHDGILQSLYAIGLGLERCLPAMENYPNKMCPHISQVNAVMQEVRSFIAGIERFIETDNFEDAITSMVASMTGAHSTHIDVRLDLDIAKALPHAQAMELLYITREALSNSLRHAKASQGVVSLRGEGDRVILEVSDDGVGFDPHHLVGRGRGLNNITARAQNLGGHLHVQSKPGQGTQIILDIPQ